MVAEPRLMWLMQVNKANKKSRDLCRGASKTTTSHSFPRSDAFQVVLGNYSLYPVIQSQSQRRFWGNLDDVHTIAPEVGLDCAYTTMIKSMHRHLACLNIGRMETKAKPTLSSHLLHAPSKSQRCCTILNL